MDKETIRERMSRTICTISPNELEKLSGDEDKRVRSMIARKKNTPVSLLEKLAVDEDEKVHAGVAANNNTPASLLENWRRTKKREL